MTLQEVTLLREALARAGERRLIWLEGEEAECIARAQSLLGETVFWLGAGPVCYAPQPAAKALQRLGQECDTLVFNAFSGFHPDAFGALAGTLCAGGLLLLLTPPRVEWPAWPDPDRVRLVAQPEEASRAGHGFIARLVRLLEGDPALSGAAGLLAAVATAWAGAQTELRSGTGTTCYPQGVARSSPPAAGAECRPRSWQECAAGPGCRRAAAPAAPAEHSRYGPLAGNGGDPVAHAACGLRYHAWTAGWAELLFAGSAGARGDESRSAVGG